MTLLTDISVILSVAISICVILAHQNIDKNVSRDIYNLSIAFIVFGLLSFLSGNIIVSIVFCTIPIVISAMIIYNGPDTPASNDMFGMSIAQLCISVFYFIFSGLFYKIVNLIP